MCIRDSPKIHGGILARLDQAGHHKELEEHGIIPIQIVCVNLYPFQETIAVSYTHLGDIPRPPA